MLTLTPTLTLALALTPNPNPPKTQTPNPNPKPKTHPQTQTPKPKPKPLTRPDQVSECGCVHQALSPMYQQMYDVGDKVSKHDVRAFLLPASCLLLTAYYLLTLTY